MKNFLLFLVIFLTAAPSFSLADIKITEVAWMGNEKSSYGEWIELFNDGSSEIDLNGAQLFEEGGKTLIITLTKKIAAGAYFLIERVTPSMPDPVVGIEDEAGSFGGSGLGNSGEFLVLKSSDGSVLDSLDASGGWPAGDSSTKQTMQLAGGSWLTATATPKAANVSEPTSSIVSSDSSSATSTTDSEELVPAVSYSYSAHSGPTELSRPATKIKAYLSAGRDRIVLLNTPIEFAAKFTDESDIVLEGDNYRWSFGDGSQSVGKQVAHLYNTPGEYVVVLLANFAGQEYASRANVKVVSPNFSVEIPIKDGSESVVYITNNSTGEANLKGWSLKTKRASFNFTTDTIVMAKKTLPLSQRITNLDIHSEEQVELIYPSGQVFGTFKPKKEKIPAVLTPGVDKFVDNTVDKLGIDMWKSQLASLEEQLKKLQEMVSINKIEPKINIIEQKNKQSATAEPVLVDKLATSTKEAETIVIPKQKRESALWRFLSGIFGR